MAVECKINFIEATLTYPNQFIFNFVSTWNTVLSRNDDYVR